MKQLIFQSEILLMGQFLDDVVFVGLPACLIMFGFYNLQWPRDFAWFLDGGAWGCSPPPAPLSGDHASRRDEPSPVPRTQHDPVLCPHSRSARTRGRRYPPLSPPGPLERHIDL